MVKFADKLSANRVVEWSEEYLDYDALKRLIKQVARRLKERGDMLGAAQSIDPTLAMGATTRQLLYEESEDEGDHELGMADDVPASPKMVDGAPSPRRASSNNSSTLVGGIPSARSLLKKVSYRSPSKSYGALEMALEQISNERDPDQDYVDAFTSEINKVEQFYTTKLAELKERIELSQASTVKMRQNHNKDDDAGGSESEDEGDVGGPSKRYKHPPVVKHAQSSLKRSFADVYRQLNYLLNFCIINYTAAVKITKKHDKVTNRKSQKRCLALVSKLKFAEALEVKQAMADLEKVYADAFHGGNLTVSRSDLLTKNKTTSESEMLHLGFRIGVIVALVFWVLWVMIIDALIKPQEAQLHAAIFIVYRGLSTFVLLLWMWAWCLYVWDGARVNYIYLFEFDSHEMPHAFDVVMRASTLTILFLLNLLMYLKVARGEFPGVASEWAAWLPMLLIIYCFSLAVYTRLGGVGPVLATVVVAPFTHVTFLSSITADYMTSLVRPLVDMTFTLCFFTFGEWRGGPEARINSVCMNSWIYQTLVVPFVISLPLWWRFAQCLRRYYETRKRSPNLLNAAKYAIAYSVVLFGAMRGTNNSEAFHRGWVASAVISTLITYTWDVTKDWGLGDPKHRYLRDRLMYEKRWPYYLAMSLDLGLRFVWTLTLFPRVAEFFQGGASPGVAVEQSPLSMYATALLGWFEVIRRSMWSIFRVEHEHLVNTQGFRRVDFVPLHFDPPGTDEDLPEETGRREKIALFFELGSFMVVVAAVAVFVFRWQLL